MSKTHAYCFTWNNYTDANIESLKAQQYKYLVFGRELAPTTGTPHLQGYIYYKHQRTISAIAKQLKGIHLTQANGNPFANRDYCTKDNNFEEYGTIPKQGARSDIVEVKEAIKEGHGIRDLVENGTIINYQGLKLAERLITYYEKPRTEKPTVQWFYGSTGTGKTRKAYELFPDAYTAMSTNRWYEGYDGHKAVIIDDMRKDFCKFHELLRILDRYSLRIEVKTSSRQFVATDIIITSCYHPREMFETREDVGQLIRRIDKITAFF